MNITETHPRIIDFILLGHCQNLLDDPRNLTAICNSELVTLVFECLKYFM